MGRRLQRVEPKVTLLARVDHGVVLAEVAWAIEGAVHFGLIRHLVLRGFKLGVEWVFARVRVFQTLSWFLHVHIVSGVAVILFVGEKFGGDAANSRVTGGLDLTLRPARRVLSTDIRLLLGEHWLDVGDSAACVNSSVAE